MNTLKYGDYSTRVLKERKKLVDLKAKVKQLERHLVLGDKWQNKHVNDNTRGNLLLNRQQPEGEIQKLKAKIETNHWNSGGGDRKHLCVCFKRESRGIPLIVRSLLIGS